MEYLLHSNRSKRGNNSWSVCCLSASLSVICSAQVVEHTAKNTEHTLGHFIMSTRLIKDNYKMICGLNLLNHGKII